MFARYRSRCNLLLPRKRVEARRLDALRAAKRPFRSHRFRMLMSMPTVDWTIQDSVRQCEE